MSEMEHLLTLLSDHFKVSDIGVTLPLCPDSQIQIFQGSCGSANTLTAYVNCLYSYLDMKRICWMRD